MKVYASKIYERDDDFMDGVQGRLDYDRRQKCSRLKNKEERLRSIYAGLLLNYAFTDAGYNGEAWKDIRLGRGEFGKPYIEGYENFNYSLSHSGEYVVCAVDSEEIGTDIQQMRPWKAEIAKRFFNSDEYERILAYPDDECDIKTREFYSMWTVKESAVKLSGRGIGAGIDHLVTARDYKTVKDIRLNECLHTRLYDEISGYMVCVCSHNNTFPEKVEMIKL